MIKKAARPTIVAVLGFVLCALVFIHTPMFESMVRRDLEQQVSRITGETLTIGSLDISPLSGNITAQDIRFSEVAAIERVKLEVNVPRLFLFKVVIRSAEVDGVDLQVKLARERKPFSTDPMALLEKGFDALVLENLLVKRLNLHIQGRNDMSVQFDGADFLLQAGFDGDAFRYSGTAAFANGQVTVNDQHYLLNMGCTFTIRRDEIEVRELTISRGELRLSLTGTMEKDHTELSLTGTVPVNMFTDFPELADAVAEIDLKGDFDHLSGTIRVSDPGGEVNGRLDLYPGESRYLVTDLSGDFRDHRVSVSGEYATGSDIQLHATATGPLLHDFKADISVTREKTWTYNARISGTDCGGGTCVATLVSGTEPVLDNLKLNLPFLKTDIRNNTGWAEIDLDWVSGKLDGIFFKGSWFDGNVQLDRLNWGEMQVPAGTGKIIVHNHEDIELPAATLVSGDGRIQARGHYRKPMLDIDATLTSFPFREGLFAVPEAQSLDISGQVSGTVQVKGDLHNPTVTGTVAVSPLELFQLPMDRGSTSFEYRDRKLVLHDPVLENGNGRLSGSGTVGVRPDYLDITMTGQGMPIIYSPLDFLRLDNATGTVRITGTSDHPEIQAELNYACLYLEQIELGSGILSFRMSGPDLIVDTETDRAIRSRVVANTDGTVQVELETDRSPIVLDPVTVTANLSFRCAGDFNDLKTFTGGGHVSQLSVSLPENIVLEGDPAELYLQGLFVQTDPFPLHHPELDLMLESGAVQLDTGELWGGITGTVHARPTAPLVKRETGLDITGVGELEMDFSGTLNEPLFYGILNVTDGSVVVPGLHLPVTNIRGRAEFEPSLLTVQQVEASFGQGNGTLNGIVSPEVVWFSTAINQLPIEFTGVIADVSGFVQLQGKPDDSRFVLSGNLSLENGLIYPDQAVLAGSGEDLSILNRIRLDLDLLTRRTRIVGAAMTLYTAPSNLELTGPAEQPVLLGVQTLSPESTILINDIPMHVQKGELRFENHFEMSPTIDITAATEIQNYAIRCRMRGSEDRIQLNLSSSPPLKERELMALLFGSGGITAGDASFAYVDREADDLSGAGMAIALNNLIAPLQRKVKNRLGVERFTITPQMFDARSTPSPIVTFEKDLSSRLTGTWSQTLVGSGENLVQLKYDMTGGKRSVITRKEIDGSVTLELEFNR